MAPDSPTVAICIATYRRPEGLERLLSALAAQQFSGARPILRVVIVDNDARDRAGAAVARGWNDRFDEFVSCVEDRQGISYARNRGLDEAGDADFIAMIDDDEVPTPGWLDELLRVQREHDADVVRGPVIPRYEGEPPAWLSKGKFLATPRHPTGTRLHIAYTHNVLFRWPDGERQRFSERYAKSGGEDSHFFGRMHRRGAVIVWADDAEVHEWNPHERQSMRWLLRRHYRIGLVRATIDAELDHDGHPRRTTAWQACTRFAAGTAKLVAGVGTPEKQVAGLTQLAAGVGRVAGLFGLWIEEYR